MTNSENDDLKEARREANTYEDEINLMDYFLVLWKRKWFIFLVSVLPALIVGLAMFRQPRDYTITFTYDMGLNEKAFKVLEYTFYSEENIEKLVKELQTNSFEKYAQNLAKTQTNQSLRGIVSFEVSPAYFGETGNVAKSSTEELQKIQQTRGTLLLMHIEVNSEKDIREAAVVFRKNFEEIIPLYSERNGLNQNVMALKGKMAAIEETRYTLNLQLERKKSTLEKLKKLDFEGLGKLPSDTILQFNNIGDNNSTYLPLPYQIQATETQIINFEEQIKANKELYVYYAVLLKLNEKLSSYANKTVPFNYTLGQFRSFLTDTLAEYNSDEQIVDYLSAYIKRIENKIVSTIPLTEKPKVYPIAKGTVKRSGMVFVVSLMISIFAAFLLEGLKKNRARVL